MDEIAAANRRDSAIESECRELCRRLLTLAEDAFDGRIDQQPLYDAAQVLRARADHIVAVWD